YALFYFVFVTLTLIVSYFTQPVSLLFLKTLGIPVPMQHSYVMSIITTIISYFLTLIFSFIFVGILYLYVRIFGGKAGYAQTYNLWAYAQMPTLLFGWIPVVSFFAGIWSLLLLIIGTSEVHQMSRMRATLLYLIPLFFVFIVVAIVLTFITYVFSTRFT
ncbi:MAG TPA: Yip1 family protein, partial [Candidatus Binatia bacterium]|nr:Yip1 family protein [Candidatus Binatia bacterium]